MLKQRAVHTGSALLYTTPLLADADSWGEERLTFVTRPAFTPVALLLAVLPLLVRLPDGRACTDIDGWSAVAHSC